MYLQDKIGITKRTFTDEGFLIIKDARISRSGIQEYFAIELGLTDRDPSSVVKLYRPDKEVFKNESMDSFSNKPVTNNHPKELVNPDNAKDVTVGHSGETVSKDGIFVTANLTVTDGQAIKDIQSGKVELSNGYTSEINFVAGKTDAGELYDAIQTNIKGNHIAIVKMGRCGSECKIGDEAINDVVDLNKLNKGNNIMSIIIDSIEYEAPAQTVQAVNKVIADAAKSKQEAEDAEEELAKEKAKKEEMTKDHKTQLDTMQAKLDDADANKVTPKMLDALVAKRTDVISVAAKVIENFDATDKDCVAIRKEVVQDQNKDLDLADKSEDYVNARFDAIADNLKIGKSNTLNDALSKHAKDGGKEVEVVDARAEFMKKSQDAWKGKTNAA